MTRAFRLLNVFALADDPFSGNPLAVIEDASGLDGATARTAWSWAARSPWSSASMAPTASAHCKSTAAGNSVGMLASVGAKDAISPTRPLRAVASCTIASFGLSTGMPACLRATASMQGPKAEQVKRMACAPVPTA